MPIQGSESRSSVPALAPVQAREAQQHSERNVGCLPGGAMSTAIGLTERILHSVLPRTSSESWAGLFVGIIAAFLLSIPLWPILHTGQQRYPDLVAGYILWTDQFKDGDYRSVLVCLALAALFGLIGIIAARAIGALWRHRSRSERGGVLSWMRSGSAVDLCGAGALFLGALWILRGYFPIREGIVALSIALTFALFFVIQKLRGLSQHHARACGLSVLLCSALTALTCVTASAVTFAFSRGTSLPASLGLSTDLLATVSLATLILSSIMLVLAPTRGLRALTLVNATLQCALPLLLCTYWQTVYQSGAEAPLVVFPNAYGKAFLILVIAMLLGAAIRGLAREIIKPTPTISWNNQVRLSTVVALNAFLFFGPPPYSVTVFDDFHLGETLIPWQQLTDFGQRLHSDFVSVQGVLGLSFGTTNWLFFDNTLATYPIAAFWVLVIANCLTSAALCRLLGTGWALLLAPITTTTLDRVLLVPLIFTVLASQFFTSSALRWVLGFGFIAALHFIWLPSSGTAVILAGLPLAALACIRVLFSGQLQQSFSAPHRTRSVIISVLLMLSGIVLLPYLAGALSFVIENGATNTVAYGVRIGLDHLPPDFPRWFQSQFLNDVVWESVRFGGWMMGAFLLGVIAVTAIRVASQNNPRLITSIPTASNPIFSPPVIVALGGAIFACALIPYSAGRIDAHALSRSGAVSMIVLGFFIPVSIALFRIRLGAWPIPLTILGLALGVRYTYAPPTFANLLERTAATVAVPHDSVHVDGPAVGLPNLGQGFISATKWDEIIRMRSALGKYLHPGETYFDLTNRSAFYYFLGLRVPSPYSADYLAANGAIQNRILERLEREQPPIAWTGPAIRFDEAPTSIRSYRLLRWFLERGYRFEAADGNQFLVRPDRLRDPKDAEHLTEFMPGVMRTDLARLPIAWGRNYPRLASRFERVAELRVDSSDSGVIPEKNGWVELRSGLPRFVLPVETPSLTPRPDFLVVTFGRRGPPISRLSAELLWRTAAGSFTRGTGLTFPITPGTLFIPLGSDLRWQRATDIAALRFEITGEAVGTKLRIEKVELLRLIK